MNEIILQMGNQMDQNKLQNQFSSVEEAAIILLSMGEESAAAVLRCFGREDLLEITQAMSRMGRIKSDTIKSTIQKFFEEYREQSGIQDISRAFLTRSLGLALGEDVAENILNTIYGDTLRPKIVRLQWLEPKWLAACIMNEHIQMQAVFLSILPPTLASDVVEALPEPMRDLVLLQVARLTEIDYQLVVELEEIINRCLDDLSMQGRSIEGIRQAADIINCLTDDRTRIVELLRAHDPEVVRKIETSMYDFFILSRQTESVLVQILEHLPLELLALALKGAESATLVNTMTSVMPRRQGQILQGMIRRLGPVPTSRVQSARRDIMQEVKALEESGQIKLQRFSEAVVV